MNPRRIVALATAPLLLAGCGLLPGDDASDGPTVGATSSATTAGELDTAAASDLGDLAEEIAEDQQSERADAPTATGSDLPDADPRVLVISIDGLRPAAIDSEETPSIYRLLVRGAGTLNARTAVERTETLPNHVCMVTGRRIAAAEGGHGVTWNTDTAAMVPPEVSSMFEVVAEAGGSSSVIAGKSKFDIFRDSWPGAVDRYALEPNMDRAADLVVDDLTGTDRDLVFWHLPGPDKAGHGQGFGSPRYHQMVRYADDAVGEVLDAIRSDPVLAVGMTVILTSDHGGIEGTRLHGKADRAADYTVPFVVWGRGVQAGDLYGLNPDRSDPGIGRPSYAGAQPVRNCDVANLATDLLGLGPVPGSQVNAGQDLVVAE